MTTALVITSSVLGEASVSSRLVRETVAKLREHDRDLRIIERDLGVDPIPHLAPDSARALTGAEPENEAQAATRVLSDKLINELQAADIVVIGAPMYNFGIASTLKAWFDHVLRARVTFRYTEAGSEGLLTGKSAIVLQARGGFYSEGPGQAMDSQEPHLRTLLGFMGITDITFVRAENLLLGPEAHSQGVESALDQLDTAIATGCARAA